MPKLAITDPRHELWEQCDAVVLSQIFHLVFQSIGQFKLLDLMEKTSELNAG